MKHCDKFENPLSAIPSVPKLSMQVVDMPCHHCGRITRVPVPHTYVDWEKVAESYRKRLEETWQCFDQMSRDVEAMHGENPAAEYMANRLRFALMDLRKKLDAPNRESGA
jgi:rRNA maturation protein Nop10